MTDDPLWYKRAACLKVDPDIFYPEKGGTTKPALKVCRGCPVRRECREEVMGLSVSEDRFGVRGGLSERERRKLRRRVA
jgi:WhiB family transcriptional regulator, redox-sensing transcriptional regulator